MTIYGIPVADVQVVLLVGTRDWTAVKPGSFHLVGSNEFQFTAYHGNLHSKVAGPLSSIVAVST